MNKWYGIVGFIETRETDVDVYEEIVTEKHYYGDVLRQTHRWTGSQNLNDNVSVSNEISILADDYLLHHAGLLRYIEYMGSFWKVSNISLDYPRLQITIGDVYNGKRQTESIERDPAPDNG